MSKPIGQIIAGAKPSSSAETGLQIYRPLKGRRLIEPCGHVVDSVELNKIAHPYSDCESREQSLWAIRAR